MALNDERWPACGGPGALPDPNSPLAQSAGPMITARPGVSGRPSSDSARLRPGGPGARVMILVPKRWAGRIIHRGRAQVEPPASWHAFDRLGLGAAAPTVASSESDTDDGVQRRLRGVRARHAVDAGTDSGRGGRRRVWQRARANCQLSARLLAPRKMQRIFWMERSFEAGWCASVDGFLSRSLVRRIRSFASPVTGGRIRPFQVPDKS